MSDGTVDGLNPAFRQIVKTVRGANGAKIVTVRIVRRSMEKPVRTKAENPKHASAARRQRPPERDVPLKYGESYHRGTAGKVIRGVGRAVYRAFKKSRYFGGERKEGAK